MSNYHVHSVPAIIGGTLAALGSCSLLIADVGSLSNLTVDKALMPVLVGLTVLTGHLAWQAWHELRLLSCIGMGIVAVVGIGLTVTDAMGRRAELRDAKTATVAGAEGRRSALQRKLAEASEILETHRTARDKECASGKGKKCDGWAYTVATWEAAVAGYETKIAALPKPQPVDAKGQRVGALAGFMGYSSVSAQTGFALLEPFMLPALLELASIVLFGFGVAHVPVRPVIPATPVRSTVAAPLQKAYSNREIVGTSVTVVPDETRVLDALKSKAGRVRSQRELSIVLGVSPAETCRMLQRCRPDRIERIWDPISKSNVIKIKDMAC